MNYLKRPEVDGPIDPLRRVFVPRPNAQGLFKTHDGTAYHEDGNGTVRRLQPKVRGKAARKAERAARRRINERAKRLRGE